MEHPGFFDRAGPFPLSEVAKATGAELAAGVDPAMPIDNVLPLSEAGPTVSPSSKTRNICRNSARRPPGPASSRRLW